MNKYTILKECLENNGEGVMTCFGSSMTPIFKFKETLLYKRQEEYEIGDIVFCKVKGRFIDAHKITKKNSNKGYMISNNHGWDNGWTKAVYGKVVAVKKGNEFIRL